MPMRSELIAQHDVLRAIDERVRRLHPNRRGWVVADPAEGRMFTVHVRPYLAEERLPPTMRLAEEEPLGTPADLEALVRDSSYVVVFPRTSRDAIVRHLPYMEHLQTKRIAWIAVWRDGNVLWTSEEEGKVVRLGRAATPEVVPLELVHGDQQAVTAQIPFRLRIDAENDKAFFSLTVQKPGGYFEETPLHYSCVMDDGAEIAGVANVDVALRVDAPDVLVLQPEARLQLRPSPLAAPRRPEQRLVLHVIYDRTMVDAAAWEASLKAADGVLTEAEFGTTMHPRHWNLSSRQSLAAALSNLASTRERVTIELWWFADVERGAIARLTAVEVPSAAKGAIGECPPSELADALGGPSFDYASGLDLFDAVDEALLDLSARIPEDDARHMVIIVGDSPPPPEGPRDVLWRKILVDEFASNARTQSYFRPALAALRQRRVPVGWLFVNPATPPELSNRGGLARAFARAQSVRKRVSEALANIDGLVVETCPSLAQVEERLLKLFDRLRGRHSIAAARLSVQEVS